VLKIVSFLQAFCLLFPFTLSAQTSNVLLTVTDHRKVPMPYVNVGIPGCTGTVTDIQGKCSLDIKNCDADDTLLVSMIGYKTRLFLLKDFDKLQGRVELTPTDLELKEVKVRSGKMKVREKGNFNQNNSMQAGFKSNDLGSEVVIPIKVKDDAWIKKFSFYITNSIYDTLFFRLNVYKIENGLPDKNILPQPVYVTTTSKRGWNSVNLEKYNIVAEGDFAIGLEWVKDLRKGDVSKGLFFSVRMFGTGLFYRKASQQEWQKAGMYGIGFNVTVAE
jgi:hypothetical protein